MKNRSERIGKSISSYRDWFVAEEVFLVAEEHIDRIEVLLRYCHHLFDCVPSHALTEYLTGNLEKSIYR